MSWISGSSHKSIIVGMVPIIEQASEFVKAPDGATRVPAELRRLHPVIVTQSMAAAFALVLSTSVSPDCSCQFIEKSTPFDPSNFGELHARSGTAHLFAGSFGVFVQG
jgi:hypothetical protein